MTFQKHAGAVRRFARLMRWANGLQQLPHRLVPPPFRLLQIGSAFWLSRALHTVARLDVATTLADQRQGVDALAQRVSAHPDALGRLLRMLAAHGVFEETSPGVFRNNRVSDPLRTDRPDCVRAMVLMHGSPEMSRPWFEHLEQGVRQGVPPFRLCHGQDLFEHLDRHPEFDRLFAQAMDSVEALSGDAFATDFDWARFSRLIDVGGSRGAKAAAILRHHPGLSALVVDRAAVAAEATRHWAERTDADALALRARMAFQPGDLLQGPLPPAQGAGDAYLLSAVLHGLDDDACVCALRQVAQAVGESGATVVVLDLVLPPLKADAAATAFDLQMFMGTRGRERTDAEWQRLFQCAGLHRVETVGLRAMGSMQVLRGRPCVTPASAPRSRPPPPARRG